MTSDDFIHNRWLTAPTTTTKANELLMSFIIEMGDPL